MEHRAGAPCDADVPGLEHLERDDRGVHQVAQFVREEPEALAPARGLSIERGLIAGAPVLGDGAGDGVVEASVQRAKVVGADGRVHFHRQLGDRLADVAVVVHDLRHGEPLQQQVVPVLDRARADLGARGQAEAQRVRQLIQEHRHAVIDLRLGWRWNRPRGHLRPAPPDDLVAVDGDEFVEHGGFPVAAIVCDS